MAAFDPVRSQYTRWAYPEPALTLDDFWEFPDPAFLHSHFAYWPDRAYQPDIRILVAGCGTNQAARIAYRNPAARIVGIDVSDTSIAHEQHLKKSFGLENLTLENMTIESAVALGTQFDLIVASGVLHHTPDPVAALRSLGSLLAPDGVISAMIYGKYFRTGIYMLQDLFRRVGLGQSPEDVAVVRQTIENLPAFHLAHNYIQKTYDLFDAGIVDTFLHPVDRPYTVPECLELVEKAGLRFQGWRENFYYYPNGQMPAEHPLFQRLANLPMPELWAAMELHHGGIGKHEFFCCRTDRPPSTFLLDFDTDKFFDLVPVLRNTQLIRRDSGGADLTAILRTPFPSVDVNEMQVRLFQCIDGERNIGRCIAESGLASSNEFDLRKFARQFFVSLWRLGHVLLRL